MISHKYKCIALHQRKAGGTSIKAIFDDVLPDSPEREYLNEGALDPDWSQTDPVIRGYFKFVVVRNPYDRFVSGWKYCNTTRNRPLIDCLRYLPEPNPLANAFALAASWAARKNGLRDYVLRQRSAITYWLKVRSGAKNLPKRPPNNFGHDYRHVTRQQWEIIYGQDGRPVVDQIFFLEDLLRDMTEFSRMTGVPCKAFPGQNVRRATDPYQSYFDRNSRSLFEKIFARDLALFPYDFDTGERHSKAPAD